MKVIMIVLLMAMQMNAGTVRMERVEYYDTNTIIDTTGELWSVLDDVRQGDRGIAFLGDSGTPANKTDDIVIYIDWKRH